MQKSEDKHITTLKVNLVKQNGVWKVSDNNEELQKALTKKYRKIFYSIQTWNEITLNRQVCM